MSLVTETACQATQDLDPLSKPHIESVAVRGFRSVMRAQAPRRLSTEGHSQASIKGDAGEGTRARSTPQSVCNGARAAAIITQMGTILDKQ